MAQVPKKGQGLKGQGVSGKNGAQGNGHNGGRVAEGGGSLIRVFVAVDMPQVVKEEIKRVQTELKRLDLLEGTYVDPDVAHLTLQFVGYIEPVALYPIKNLLESVKFQPIEVQLGSVGEVGDPKHVRIVWLEVLGQELADLAYRIEKELSLGTVSLRRRFQAHITLVRVKSAKDAAVLRRALAKVKVSTISFTIDEFVLKQSTLTSDGPVYVALERYGAQE